MQEGNNPEFEADATLLSDWRESLYEEGIRIRVGRWKINGNPIAILVDFTSLFSKKDAISLSASAKSRPIPGT